MKQNRETEGMQGKGTLDVGFGGLFKGLGDFIDLLGGMVEMGEEEDIRTGERTGEFRVKGLGDMAKGVYGFTVRTGIGGEPRVEPFGNIRTTEEGPEVAEMREPLVDLFDEDQEIVIVAELPGVREEEINVEVQDDIVFLETTGQHKFSKEILLSEPVDGTSLKIVYKNGILEIRLKKGEEIPQEGESE